MKKFLSILLLVSMLSSSLFSFAGCGSSTSDTETDASITASNNSEETTADTEETAPEAAEEETAEETAEETETAEVIAEEAPAVTPEEVPEDTVEEAPETAPDHVIVPAEGEVILSLYTPGDLTGWLDNNDGYNLSIEELNGVEALVHSMANTSISFKKKFSIDWSQYERENIYIVADIYIDETPITTDYKGSLKIKNGDKSDDTGNTSENNQLNFDILGLDLQGGWNSYVLPLSEAVPDKGDDYTIADWFCLWVNNLVVPYELAIGRLEIVYNPAA